MDSNGEDEFTWHKPFLGKYNFQKQKLKSRLGGKWKENNY